jgi:hypothetical protein
MRRSAGFAVITALAVMMSGCGDDSTPSRTEPSPAATTGSTSASASAEVTAFEKYSGLAIPADATDVTVKTSKNAAGDPVYRAGFSLPSDATDAFCANGGMGGLTGVDLVGQSLRREFGYTGPDHATAVCSASLPGDESVQRRVLITGTDQTLAQVQVLAYQMAR